MNSRGTMYSLGKYLATEVLKHGDTDEFVLAVRSGGGVVGFIGPPIDHPAPLLSGAAQATASEP